MNICKSFTLIDWAIQDVFCLDSAGSVRETFENPHKLLDWSNSFFPHFHQFVCKRPKKNMYWAPS